MENKPRHWLERATRGENSGHIRKLKPLERDEYCYVFSTTAHDGQLAPEGGWRTWLIMAGRGFGKTRAGAEWVRAVADAEPGARIALVAATLGEARSLMVEGKSGLLACCPPQRRPTWEPSLRKLTFANGTTAFLYGAIEPESLCGPQHNHAWCDEIAKWANTHSRAMQAWDNLLMGLRLGQDQRVVATTTPRAVPLLRRIADSEGLAVTRGRTIENGYLAERFRRKMQVEFGRSLLARQELDGELIEEIEGALWSRALLEACREEAASAPAARVVIGVDPPASAQGDACGIVVCALGEDGVARVLADCSVRKPTPESWARAVAMAARGWAADRVVAEANNGGDMVRSVMPQLEDELCGLMAGGAYEGPGRSPDRADALVWALTELMLGSKGVPRVRGL